MIFPTKIQKIRQTSSLILIQDNQCGDDARHPSAESKDKDDEHRPTAAVDHRQRRKDNGWFVEGAGVVIFILYKRFRCGI